VSVALLAIYVAIQTALQELPLSGLPFWAGPIIKGAIAGLSIVIAYRKGLGTAPTGMTQVPTSSVTTKEPH
jgi:hypothetical protein